jgi:hypothetical protein
MPRNLSLLLRAHLRTRRLETLQLFRKTREPASRWLRLDVSTRNGGRLFVGGLFERQIDDAEQEHGEGELHRGRNEDEREGKHPRHLGRGERAEI